MNEAKTNNITAEKFATAMGDAPPATRPEPPFSIYSKREKAVIITLVSTAATFSGFASNIYFPSLPTIASDLSVSIVLVNLTVTSYMILQGLSPSFWGALADVNGRRTAYIFTFLVFFAACVSLANTKTYAALVGLRCLQSAGSAATIALGSGVIGDITTRAERGGLMGIFQAGLLAPTAIGPVIGGAIADSLGWRAVFWFLAIYSGVFLVVLILMLPETLRARVGNGSVPASGFIKFPLNIYQRRYAKRSPAAETQSSSDLAPRKSINILGSFLILLDKRVLSIIMFLAIYYTVWQMSITLLSTLLQSIYGLNDTQVGLTFMANGIGCIVGTISTGKVLDIDYRRIKARCEATKKEFRIDRARLRTVWIWSAMQMSSLLVFGWTIDKHVYIAVPIICTFFTGWGAMSVQSMVSTYLVDVFPDRSASASAALNLARCLMGAGGTAAASPLLNAIGIGWGFTTLVAIMFAALGLVGLQIYIGRHFHDEEKEANAGNTKA